jgi:HK97 family phage major capsid protein
MTLKKQSRQRTLNKIVFLFTFQKNKMKEKFNSFLQTKGITTEDYAKKSAEEMADLYNEYNDVQRKEIEGLIEAKATKEDIDSAVNALKESQIEQMKSLNSAMKEMGLSIKALTEGEKRERPTATIGEQIKEALKENVTKLRDMSNGWITVKAVGNITSANISGGNVPVEQRLAGLDDLASRRIRLFDLISRGNSTSNIVSWVSKANREGAVGGTSEGSAKNQIDFDLVVDSESAKKRTGFIKISTEMLNDVAFIESEIRNELMVELMKDIEAQVYEGDGTGNNLNGIRTVATAFSAGTFALAVDNANELDVITVAQNQIDIADQDMTTAILMHPSDVTALRLLKVSSSDKRYVFENGVDRINGVPVIKSTLVTQDEYLVGHFPNALMLDHESISIQMGLDADDFTKNMRTIIAEWRGMVIVKTNKRASFVKGVFSTDKAALETA